MAISINLNKTTEVKETKDSLILALSEFLSSRAVQGSNFDAEWLRAKGFQKFLNEHKNILDTVPARLELGGADIARAIRQHWLLQAKRYDNGVKDLFMFTTKKFMLDGCEGLKICAVPFDRNAFYLEGEKAATKCNAETEAKKEAKKIDDAIKLLQSLGYNVSAPVATVA